ncbi:DNA-directed RNA polymerase II subunit RPB1-like [Frankliniella occidentalis]|uniref:DNA-directed RNA polymerase II subunit RPB1-like n=1 Tax=Frankliniella occidentalis TaxID=133901 RepID=A0A9C6XC32_FRAOC|nr:DNA-directed RNA polymerase II subunit RPB1-like [Frankliniella occidentalis]
MECKTMILAVLLAALVAAEGAVTPSTPFSTTAVNRGRGSRRAFIGRGGGRPRGSPAPSAVALASQSTPRNLQQHLQQQQPTFAPLQPTFAPPQPSFSPATFSPTPSTFAPTFAPTFAQQTPLRVSRPTPTPPGGLAPLAHDVVVTPRRSGSALGFSPHAAPFTAPLSTNKGPRPRATPVPIVALKFNLRDDGSYSTSSETGDGTVRQEHGQFNGAGMAVQGMYAYQDHEAGPVQVNYVADEYGFQPQGPNIHPAIMMAVAEQVNAARSAKSRKGAAGLNGLRDDGDLDYDDDNGAGTSPAPIKYRKAPSRTVRRVVVRRL